MKPLGKRNSDRDSLSNARTGSPTYNESRTRWPPMAKIKDLADSLQPKHPGFPSPFILWFLCLFYYFRTICCISQE